MSPEQLLAIAQQLGIACLALTDINNTSGALDFVRLAQRYNVKPVVGIEFNNRFLKPADLAVNENSSNHFIGIAKNNEGFYELNKFLTHRLHNSNDLNPVPDFTNAFVIYPFTPVYRKLKSHEYIGVKPSDLNKLQFTQWKHYPSKLVAWQPVTFRNKTDFNTHRLLRAIDNNTLLSKLVIDEQACPDEVILSAEDIKKLYQDYPQLIANTEHILSNCEIDFQFGINKNKKFFTGTAKQDYHLLMSLCYEGMKYRYSNPDDVIIERFEKEIKLITELNFSAYFLINHDIVKYAQRNNYFYIGRGSGANSLVAYLLRITDVDPIDLDLYFERFINTSRTSPPDFDIDFSWNERDDVIRYIFEKHGYDNTVLLATYSTFQSRAVIRELGKVFGLPKAEIDLLVENRKHPDTPDNITKLIYRYAQYIHDFPSHLSIHAGGILISDKPIYYYTATNMPPKNFPLTQFSMLEAEDVGLYKFDILSQRGLGKVKDTVEIIRQNRNITIDIHDVKRFKEDKKIEKNLTEANLMGCFYVESPGMRMLLTKLKAKTYLDLVAASSIIRPGVAASGMMREYILRFHQPARRQYIHPMMKELMEETFGVMVYQEDVIKVAHHFAKLTLTEADMLRRGMSGKYRGRDEFKKVEDKFFRNCKAEGYPDEITKEVWRQIESFAGYAFSKGHSASYAVESYQCMFLKTYYPLEFMVAVINNGGGFFATQFYVHEARMCGAKINAPDINRSDYLSVINGIEIHLGFNLVAELESKVIDEFLNERNRNGEYTSLRNFMERNAIAVEQLRILIRVGAFRFTGRTKKQLLWDIHTVIGAEKKTVTRNELFKTEIKNFVLPPLYHHQLDDALDEIEILGFPLCNPFQLIKDNVEIKIHVADLPRLNGTVIEIIGYLVTTKSARTKHGDPMLFATWLDENGKFFDTTHFPKIAAQFPIRGRSCYRIIGKVAEEFGFYSIDLMELQRLDSITREDLTQCDTEPVEAANPQ